MLFLLIWLISVTDFILHPMFKYIGAVAFPFIASGILYYLTRPLFFLLEIFNVYRSFAFMLIFILILFLGLIIVIYTYPIAQYQFMNLTNITHKMVVWAQDLISYWQANHPTIPHEIN